MKERLVMLLLLLAMLIFLSCDQTQEDTRSKQIVQNVSTVALSGDSSIIKLEQMFGGVSQEGIGSGVYRITKEDSKELDSVAWGHFTEYLGSKYSQETASLWKKGWAKVYVRNLRSDSSHNINTELNRHKDPRVKSSVPLLLEFVQPVVKARQALGGVYNRKDIKELAIFVIGDGEAYSGLLIAWRYEDGTGCTLIAMAD
jgi:hypothetical protein